MAREEVEPEWVPQETEESVEEPYPGEPQGERQGIAGEEAELPSVEGAEQGASSNAEGMRMAGAGSIDPWTRPEELEGIEIYAPAHPSVDVLGHPTGRVIGRRRGAALDLDAVVGAAVDHGVALEVNARPDRLDLDDVSVRAALGQGAKIVVSTDAHAAQGLAFMRWGGGQARRGWAEKGDVLNALPLSALLKHLHRER